MLFNSPIFLFVFLPVLLALYFLSPWALRNAILLIASLLFYAWGEGGYLIVLLASILFNYAIGLVIERAKRPRGKQAGLVVGVAANIGALLYFKYANFTVDNANSILIWAGSTPVKMASIHLPIGISFFVFQGISYVVDVYRGVAHAQNKLGQVALFKAFFPQLIAGPIIRYVDIQDQLSIRHVGLDRLAAGAERFIIGLFKKTIIANQCAGLADAVFNSPSDSLSTPFLWAGALAYALQIYFDFSAYSDMAIGLAKVFGFDFMENFNYPYVALSIQDFWRRWHISLSTWFRDYVYIPLGGNRKSTERTYLNLFTVFFLTGLWHGASWNYIVWGLFHGSFLALERIGLSQLLLRTGKVISHTYTILVVIVGWVFFRAEDLTAAIDHIRGMFTYVTGDPYQEQLVRYDHFGADTLSMVLLGILLSTPIFPGLFLTGRSSFFTGVGSTAVRYMMALVMFVVATAYIVAGTYNPFIYFRF